MEINKKYKLVFYVFDKTLTYTGTVLKIDDTFIKFKDKFGEIINYSKSCLISYTEIVEEEK